MFKEVLNGFHLCLEISCSHPCFMENQIWRFKSHGCHIVCHYFISSFFFNRERYLFFQRGIYCCSPNFYFLFRKFKQGLDKTCMNIKGILSTYSRCTSKGDLCLLCTLCIFFLLNYISSLDSPPV